MGLATLNRSRHTGGLSPRRGNPWVASCSSQVPHHAAARLPGHGHVSTSTNFLHCHRHPLYEHLPCLTGAHRRGQFPPPCPRLHCPARPCAPAAREQGVAAGLDPPLHRRIPAPDARAAHGTDPPGGSRGSRPRGSDKTRPGALRGPLLRGRPLHHGHLPGGAGYAGGRRPPGASRGIFGRSLRQPGVPGHGRGRLGPVVGGRGASRHAQRCPCSGGLRGRV